MTSNTVYIMTLANSIIGVGILAMPFCFQKCGILLSILLVILSNLVTRLACHYLIKTSIKARRRNLEFIASYVFGPSGKLTAELCVIGFLMGTCVTYFVVVGDLGPQIIAKLTGINHSDSLRTFTMIVVTIFCIIPLCLLRNIASLSMICISSILFYFCLVTKIFLESETKIWSSYWYENVYWWRPSGITQCLPIFSMALSCQMQIFEIYESLPNQTLDRMNHIIKYGTGICTLVYIGVGFFGYVAFYDQAFSGNVLLSLSPSLASDILQMGFVISVAVSFPLVVFPCRASLYSLLYHRSHSETSHYIPEHRFKYITISMVFVTLIIGILIPSIELIIGLVGSTIGVAICIMFPALCFIKTNKKNSTEKLAAQFLVVFGFCVMVLGTYANLGAIDDQQQSSVNIERLPDIHIPKETENIFIAPAKVDQLKEPIEMGPEKPIDTNIKPKMSKRRTIKPSKSQRSQTDAKVREINLNDKIKEMPSKVLDAEHVVQVKKEGETISQRTQGNAQSSDKPKPNVAAASQSTTVFKSPDSLINNDAIRREEQEIAINANDNRKMDAERAQELLDAVKNQLSKQNEANHQIMLQKINEISDKVDRIAQKDDEKIAHLNPDPIKPNEKVPVNSNQSVNLNVRTGNDVKNLPLPPVPVAKLLSERQSSSIPNKLDSLPTKSIASDSAKMENAAIVQQKLSESVVELPRPIEVQQNENVRRDLLSHSNDLQTKQEHT